MSVMTEGNLCCKICKESILAVAPVSTNNSTFLVFNTAHNLGNPLHEQYPEKKCAWELDSAELPWLLLQLYISPLDLERV